jgi:hypothetical protein
MLIGSYVVSVVILNIHFVYSVFRCFPWKVIFMISCWHSTEFVSTSLGAGRQGFDSWQRRDFFFFFFFFFHHCVQAGSGAHPDSYSVGTGSSFSENKVAGA